MSPTAFDLEKIHALYRAGQLELAKKQYNAFLKNHPHNAEAWHALGMIHVEEKNLTQAAECLNNAVIEEPNTPTFQLHLANVFKMEGQYAKATEILDKIVKLHPTYTPAFNNLGILYYTQGKFLEAILYYQSALEKEPHYIDAYYNLGLALTRANRLEQAAHTYQQLLEYAPQHSAGRFQLGRVYMQQNQWEKALFTLITLEKNYPVHLETQINLATCYLKQGELEKAKIHYLKALQLSPNDLQVLFNLGHISMQENNITEAVHYYDEVVKINPDDFSAHNNLGAIYIFQQKSELALQHFKEALRLEPENAYINHILKILAKDPCLLTSPPAYISSLFDYYADHYEPHLLKALHYQAPQVLLDAFLANCPNTSQLNVLDIGCGTGLCGEVFKPYSAHLTGVDLSEQMLKIADDKKIYDDLVKDNYIDFLSKQSRAYDLIVAGDVIIYSGELELVFKYIKQALTPQGIFIFNAEISKEKDFEISAAGRFQHTRAYLDKNIKNNDLSVAHYQTATTRTQNHEPVHTHIYVLRLS